jgi:hypothetical protein
MPVTSDPRRRRKAHDRHDKDSQKKDRSKPSTSSSRTTRKSTPTSKDRSRERDKERDKDLNKSHGVSPQTTSTIVPEMDRRPSAMSVDVKVAYPSFSRAHSKEFVGSRENVVHPRLSLYTPDPTVLNSETKPTGKESKGFAGPTYGQAPPSPPLTAQDPDLRRSKSGHSMRTTPSKIETHTRPNSLDGSRLPQHQLDETPRASSAKETHRPRRNPTLDLGSGRKKSKHADSVAETDYEIVSEVPSESHSSTQQSTVTADSDATATAQPRSHTPGHPPNPQLSPQTVSDPSPKTPSSIHVFPNPTVSLEGKPLTNNFAHISEPKLSPQLLNLNNNITLPPPPPPPPPPAAGQSASPHVDYLLQNGGLPQVVPRGFFGATNTPTLATNSPYGSTTPASFFHSQQSEASKTFSSFHRLLDDYLQVISKNGSVAVATGYRSVARRLLDRLETVFNRNISSETCECIMCSSNPSNTASNPSEETRVSWGEILEFVSGRRDLPAWPPFTIEADAQNHDLASIAEAPMQKLDVDVPEEYREHYIRQSKKTKQVVQAWLHHQSSIPTSPPQEIDDETLLFAMFTHLEAEKRPLFTALLRGLPNLPSSRAPTPKEKVRSDLMERTSLALRRLYRLPNNPRDSECALYLLKNGGLHGVLATLAAVSAHEWDILVSGRFDGFLWSGAENNHEAMPANTPHSRNTTPFSPASQNSNQSANIPRRQTPSFGAPVQLDEDTEMAVLGEVEREIFGGMDALEDAFEALHVKAESVRAALRARAGGLAMAASQRRGSADIRPEVRGNSVTPSSAGLSWPGGMWEVETDDGVEWRSELAPDDSASNISSKRRRKRGERREPKTPGTVAEED